MDLCLIPDIPTVRELKPMAVGSLPSSTSKWVKLAREGKLRKMIEKEESVGSFGSAHARRGLQVHVPPVWSSLQINLGGLLLLYKRKVTHHKRCPSVQDVGRGSLFRIP